MSSESQAPCECEQLENVAVSEDWPISYDPKRDDFKLEQQAFTEGKPGHLTLQYCPWCGGSLEGQTKHSISEDMLERIQELQEQLQDLTTLDEIEQRLGPPTRRVDSEFMEEDETAEFSQVVFEKGNVQVWVSLDAEDELSLSFALHTS